MEQDPGLRSSAHPDGWIGEPEELSRARLYRKIAIGCRLSFSVLIAVWIVVTFATDISVDFLLVLLVLPVGLWIYLERQVSRIIGTKWNFRLERQQPPKPIRDRPDAVESNPVEDMLSRKHDEDD